MSAPSAATLDAGPIHSAIGTVARQNQSKNANHAPATRGDLNEPIRLDTTTRIVSCGVHRGHLRPQAALVLEIIARKAGAVATTVELCAAINHSNQLADAAQSLTVAICALRDTLRRIGSSGSLITVRGLGYRIAERVELVRCDGRIVLDEAGANLVRLLIELCPNAMLAGKARTVLFGSEARPQ